jgi:hypothetical protein
MSHLPAGNEVMSKPLHDWCDDAAARWLGSAPADPFQIPEPRGPRLFSRATLQRAPGLEERLDTACAWLCGTAFIGGGLLLLSMILRTGGWL